MAQRTQPLKVLSVLARERRPPPSAAVTARTSHAFTDSAFAACCRIDRRPQALRQPQRDPPRAAVIVGFRYRCGRLVGQVLDAGADGELRVAAAQSHVDRSGCELAGDLLGSVGQGLEQREADRRLQRRGQPIGQGGRFGAAGRGCDSQFVPYPVDVRLQIHGVMVTSL